LKDEELLDALVNLARNLEFDVRFDRGSFRDGCCRIQKGNIIVLNRTSPTPRKVAALAQALSDQPLDGVFLLPAVREAIEKTKTMKPQLLRALRPTPRRHHG